MLTLVIVTTCSQSVVLGTLHSSDKASYSYFSVTQSSYAYQLAPACFGMNSQEGHAVIDYAVIRPLLHHGQSSHLTCFKQVCVLDGIIILCCDRRSAEIAMFQDAAGH